VSGPSLVDRPSPSPSREREGSLAGACRIQGYAAVFDRVDRAGDVFRRGVFADAVPVPLLVQHRGAALGDILAIGEDLRGLWVEALVADPEVARLVRRGALRGLSVGYRALAVRQGAWREVLRAALVEVSLVAVPMQAASRVEAVFEN
jgi:HK97 family phage prohead protease